MRKITIRQIVLLGLLSALVFAASGFRVTIPLPIDKAAVHLGNVVCVLSGLLLGPVGGVASGLGSFFFDLSNPLYAPEAAITLVNKFFLGFVAGFISHSGGRKGADDRRNLAAGIAASLIYVALYMTKSWVLGIYLYSLQPLVSFSTYVLPKLVTSVFNGIVAVLLAVPLCGAVRGAARKSGFLS